MKILEIKALIYGTVNGVSTAYRIYGGVTCLFYFNDEKKGELRIDFEGEKFILVTDTPYGYLISELEKGIPIKQHVVTITDGKPFNILEIKA